MLYWLIKLVFTPLVRAIYRPAATGVENIPARGAAILASNHLAVFDSVFLPVVSPRKIVFIGKSDYFAGRGIKGRLIAGFMKGVGTIPVDRSGGRGAEQALELGLERLRKGGLFGIYPEGTRSPDGRLYRGKTGVARLALVAQVPVIPVGMIGTNIAQPIGKRIPRRKKIGVVIGEPLDFSRFYGRDNDRDVLREVTDEIMSAIMALSGQEYVDTYSATMKARLASSPTLSEMQGDAPHVPGHRTLPEKGSSGTD